MWSLKRMSFIAFTLSAISMRLLYSEEPVCHRCEEIREYNAEHHHNFEYYDEFLTAEGEKKQETANSPKNDDFKK